MHVQDFSESFLILILCLSTVYVFLISILRQFLFQYIFTVDLVWHKLPWLKFHRTGLQCSSLERQIYLSCVLLVFLIEILLCKNHSRLYIHVKWLIQHAHPLLRWSKSELMWSRLLCFSWNHGHILFSIISGDVVPLLTSIGNFLSALPKGKVNVSLRATNWTTVKKIENDLCLDLKWLTYRSNAFWYGPDSLGSFWSLYIRGGTWTPSVKFEF